MANEVKTILGLDMGVFMNTGTPAAPVYTYIGCYDTASLDLSSAELEVTCGSSGGYKEFLTGLHEWSIPISGTIRHADGTAAPLNITAENLVDLELSRTLLMVQFQVGKGTGLPIYSGNAYLSKVQLSANVKDKGSFSATIRGTGVLSKTLQP